MMDLKQIELKPLERVSPSQFTRLKKCPYSSVLSNSISRPLLPYSPSIHLGTIIHKCLREIFSTEISTEEEFDQKWIKFEKDEEKKLNEYSFNFLIPLSQSIPGYTIKKLQIKSILIKKLKKSERNDDRGYEYVNEKRLESKDAKIAGSIDHMLRIGNYVKLLDTKTGEINNDEGQVKDSYKEQLKLYAYLYAEEFGKYPQELSVRDLNQNETAIPFTNDECDALAKEAKSLLESINRSVVNNDTDKLARPEIELCNSCLYRPACKYHWNTQIEDSTNSFTDVKGVLISLNQYRNGAINITLESIGAELTITSLENVNLESLQILKGKDIGVYNVIKSDLDTIYKSTKWTTIYEV